MDFIRRLLLFWVPVIFFAIPANAYITANPNPVTFSGTTQSGGMTSVSWGAGTASKEPYAVYYTTNDANETLFAEGKQGVASANFIQLGSKYEFCLWGNNKAKKIECVKVKTSGGGGTSGGSGSDFIKNVAIDPSYLYADFTFKTTSTSLPVVSVSVYEPLPFDEVSENDEPVFKYVERANFAQPGTSHQTRLPNLRSGLTYYYVISARDVAKNLYYRVKGSFRLKLGIVIDLGIHGEDPGVNTFQVRFNAGGAGAAPLVQASEQPPHDFETFGSTDPRQIFNSGDVAAAATASREPYVAQLNGLKPDTRYYYVISAWQRDDGVTYWSHYQGEFRTKKLTRTVTVTFDELVGFSDFTYDVYFTFCVNGKMLPDAEFGPGGLESNDRTKLNWYGRTFSTTLTDSPDKLLIQVRGFHSESSTCGTMTPPCSAWDDGANECGQWSVAQTRFDITGQTPYNFVVLAQPRKSTGSELKFGVNGTIDVQYTQP